MVDSEINIIKQVEIPEALIKMRGDGIIYVLYKENVTMDIELQVRLFELFKEITGNKKTPFIFEACEGFILTNEAKYNSARLEQEGAVGASAIIVKNLASRIVANFFIKVTRSPMNYKLFSNTKDAAEWLKSLSL